MTKIYVAGGCFWGVEAYFQKIRGVIETTTGYLNGPGNKIGYKEVCAGSGHAEAVRVLIDEEILSFENFFQLYMLIIDPFSRFKQGNDFGVQYRIGLYFENDSVLKIFENLLEQWELKNSPSQIELQMVKNFIIAEGNHQNYLVKNPDGYCHINLFTIPKQFLK